MALPEASAPAIFRAAQKDEYFTNYLASSASEVLRLFGNRTWHRYSRHLNTASYLGYNALTTLRNFQTLGEEYTGILQVDDSYINIPSKSIQLLYILFGAFGESLLNRILHRLKRNVIENEELLAGPKKFFIKMITIASWSLPLLQEVHQAVFFFKGQHYHIAKRVTSVNYVDAIPGRRPRVGTLRPLGIPYFLRALLTGAKSFPKLQQDEIVEQTDNQNEKSDFVVCSGCLEDNLTPSALPCGHIFCNLCSRNFKSCAICRAPYLNHRVVPLQNYVLDIA